MEIVQPIRDEKQLSQMKEILASQSQRNFILFELGLNSGLRISDILKLKVKDVRNQTHFILRETKTGKPKRLKLTPNIKQELDQYIKVMSDNYYLIGSREYKPLISTKKKTKSPTGKTITTIEQIKNTASNSPIDRVQAYRILNSAAKQIGLGEIGTHSMRKSFGYHFYNKHNDATGKGLTFLQEIFNHSTPAVTLRYIGMTQDSIDSLMDDFVI